MFGSSGVDLAKSLAATLDSNIAADIALTAEECSDNVHDACLRYIMDKWEMGWNVSGRFVEGMWFGHEVHLTLIDPTADAVRIDNLDAFVIMLETPNFKQMKIMCGPLEPEASHLRHEAIVGGWSRWDITPLSLEEEKEVMMDKAIDRDEVIGQWFEGM